jgi:ABC-type Na+ efflux pump, permease component
MFFASLNLAIGIYSKSSKEAQTYLMPVSILSLIPTYFTYSMDLNSINMQYLCIPIVNVVCIIKEILAGVMNIAHLGIVALWLFVYTLIAFSFANYMFKKESVIFRI